VAFEYRGKIDGRRWRGNWDRAIFFGSLVPAALWGVMFGNVLRGVPINADFDYAGGLGDLLNVYSLVGGLTTLSLFLVHGALFVALKTRGGIEVRARRVALSAGAAAAVLAVIFLLWTQLRRGTAATATTALPAAATLLLALAANRMGRERWAFGLSGVAVVLFTATVFVALYPDVLPSTTNAAHSLTVHNARSTDHTLRLMTWVTAVFLPLVLAYQAWTYWVFRQRVSVADGSQADGGR
jgi:cytochrome d ubiquinol oxidase subunit II